MNTKQKTLQEQLEAALADQDYEQAAILRDRINGTQYVDESMTKDEFFSDLKERVKKTEQEYIDDFKQQYPASIDDCFAKSQQGLNKAIAESHLVFERMVRGVWPKVLVAAIYRILIDHHLVFSTEKADGFLVKVSNYNTMTADIFFGPHKVLVLRRKDDFILIETP